jgi:hypothetical protein
VLQMMQDLVHRVMSSEEASLAWLDARQVLQAHDRLLVATPKRSSSRAQWRLLSDEQQSALLVCFLTCLLTKTLVLVVIRMRPSASKEWAFPGGLFVMASP